MTPLYKNNARGYYEGQINGHRLIVPFEDFDAELVKRAKDRPDSWRDIPAAEDAVWFLLIDAAEWDRAPYIQTKEEEAQAAAASPQEQLPPPAFEASVTWEWIGTLELEAEGEDAPLERMAEYFYSLYQKAEDGSPKEARLAQVWLTTQSVLARRDLVHELERITTMIHVHSISQAEAAHELDQRLVAMSAALVCALERLGKEGTRG